MSTDTLSGIAKKKDKLNVFVHSIFKSLDSAGVEYCLLRGFDELFCNEGYLEIDLLVNKSQLPLFSSTVAEIGFVELPSWGHAPHKFFVVFDKNRGDWIKLDIVTELRYGKPIRRLRIDLVDACLQERQFNTLYTLSPVNELFTLFLHCLLDKEQFRQSHQIRLIELKKAIDNDFEIKKRIEELIQQYLLPILDWKAISNAIENQDWQSLLKKRYRLIRKFSGREPFLNIWRNTSSRLIRRLRPLFFAVKRRGISLALLAPDGAGKSTLARELVSEPILKAHRVYMGTNIEASSIGLPTTRWLHYQLKSFKNIKNSKKTRLFLLKGLNFCNKLAEQWLRAISAYYHLLRGRIVVFDRYIYDSWVNKKKRTLWKRLRRILFEGSLPEPDLVIFLDAPGDVLFRRKGEHTPEWLEQQRQAYLGLKDSIPQMQIVNAGLPAESVKREVIGLIWKHYALKVKN